MTKRRSVLTHPAHFLLFLFFISLLFLGSIFILDGILLFLSGVPV